MTEDFWECSKCSTICPSTTNRCLNCGNIDLNLPRSAGVQVKKWAPIPESNTTIGTVPDKTPCQGSQEIKADAGKPRLSLVPPAIIKGIAEIREYGNAKYKDPNSWRDVTSTRYIDAAYRHWLEVVKDAISNDEESGLPHLWHVACNIAFLCSLLETQLKPERK